MTAAPAGNIPEKLGSFEISGLLGEGGSAFVYAATDGYREVALKVLHPEIGLEPREVDRFLDEADRMRRVKHRALVPVVRAGLLPGGRPYIAMPRLRGSTLAAALRDGPMPLAVALPMFEDLAEGLATLHDAGLVHRDIKPENVFFLKDESRLVLLDLGIARETASAPSTTTKAGMMRGTPAYMAPERFFGKPASVRSDLFELTLVLYAMLTSKLPWDGDDPSGRLDPKPPSERGVLLPLPYIRVIMSALSVDVGRRPETARELIAQLRAAGPSPSRASALGNARTELSLVTPPQALPPSSQVPMEASSSQETLPSVTTNSPVMPNPTLQSAPHAAPAAGNARLLVIGGGIALVGALAGAIAGGVLVLRPPASVPGATDLGATSQATATAEVLPALTAPTTSSTASSEAPSASVSVPVSAPSLAEGTVPVPGRPGAAASTMARTSVGGSMPASCNQWVAMMCSPTSGAEPNECEPVRKVVAGFHAVYSPQELDETCTKYYTSSSQALARRRASTSKPPALGGPPQ